MKGKAEPEAREAEANAEGNTNEPKRRRRRWPIVVGVVVVVVLASGIGFWTWHEQPSFCSAICHDPMDAYVDGYLHDTTLMANVHGRAKVTCLKCHEATIDEQVKEGLSWVRGTFSTDKEGHLTVQGVTADKKMCAKAGCHDWQDVRAATENWGGAAGVNPHASHLGEAIDCSNCHEAHGTSYMYCNTCHDYAVPNGWNNPR